MLSLKLLISFISEGVLMAYVAPGLTGVRLGLRKVSIIGAIYGVSIFLIRSIYQMLDIPLGTHTIILLCLFTATLKYVSRISWLNALVGMFICYSIILIGDNILLLPVLLFLKIPLENLFNSWYHVLACYIVDIPLIIMSILIQFVNFRIIDYRKILESDGIV